VWYLLIRGRTPKSQTTKRFTDFLVFEVDLKGQVAHIRSIGMPDPSARETESKEEVVEESWSERFDAQLQPFLSSDAILELKKLYLDGPRPQGTGGQKHREEDKRKVLSEVCPHVYCPCRKFTIRH
jgi:hypothetical protein